MYQATWHGSDDEWRDLESAIRRHCTCRAGEQTPRDERCPADQMLDSQRILDHVLAMRRLRQVLIREEFSEERQAV